MPADLHLAQLRLVLAGLLGEGLEEFRLRGGAHVAVAAADAEPEASLQHRRRGRRRLGYYRRVDADGGAGHASAQAHPLGGGGDTPDHGPHERALTLSVDPGVIVIRDPGRGETYLLRSPSVADEVAGGSLFTREYVSHLGHRLILL